MLFNLERILKIVKITKIEVKIEKIINIKKMYNK